MTKYIRDNSKRTVRLGLIGCGGIARWSHLPAIFSEDVKNNIEVVAACDINKESLQEIGKRYRIPDLYTDYHDILVRDDIDAVDITAGHKINYEIIPQAAKAGKHIFVEKPMTGTLREAEEIAKIVKENKIKFQVGFMRHFWWSYRKAIELITSGEIGAIEGINVLFWSGALSDLLNNGIHVFDLIQYFGGPVQEVYAMTKQTGPKAGSIAITLSFPNQVVGNLFLSSIGLVWNGVRERVEIIGDNRKMILCENERKVSLLTPGDVPTKYWESSLVVHWITGYSLNGFTEQFKHFAHCILNDETPQIGVETGILSIRLKEAIERSISEKKVIKIF